jgi:hypothetical protein
VAGAAVDVLSLAQRPQNTSGADGLAWAEPTKARASTRSRSRSAKVWRAGVNGVGSFMGGLHSAGEREPKPGGVGVTSREGGAVVRAVKSLFEVGALSID